MTSISHVPTNLGRSRVCARMLIALVLTCAMLLGACTEKSWRPANERVYTEAELRGLRGKSRDEIREFLGAPTGLYTTDAKGRWHYPHMKIEDPEMRTQYEATVKIYFSQLGEQRATIIEITKRTD